MGIVDEIVRPIEGFFTMGEQNKMLYVIIAIVLLIIIGFFFYGIYQGSELTFFDNWG